MSGKLRIRRGIHSALPALGIGEQAYTLDDKVLSIGGLSGNEVISGGSQGLQGVTGPAGEGLANTYVVPTVAYPTIQSAIDAAFAAGHHDSNNLAVVAVSPGNYTENLTLKSGVCLLGRGGGSRDVRVIGKATYQASINQSQALNTITVHNINFHSNSAGNTFELSGSNASRLNMRDCSLTKAAGDSSTILVVNGSQTFMFCDRTSIQHSDPAGLHVDVQSGRMEIYRGFISTTLTVAATASTVVRVSDFFYSDACNIGNVNFGAPNLIELASASAQAFFTDGSLYSGLAGSNIFLFSASGRAEIRKVYVTGNFGIGFSTLAKTTSGGGTFLVLQCGISPSVFVDPQITIIRPKDDISFDPVFQKIHVGGNNGFTTISSAISWAVTKGLTDIKLLMEPGTYTENITVPANTNLNIQPVYSNDAHGYMGVVINGQLTFNPVGLNQIIVDSVTFNPPSGKSCLVYGGTGQGTFRMVNCAFNGSSDTSAIVLNNTNSSFVSFIKCTFNHSISSAQLMDINVPNVNIYGQSSGSPGITASSFPIYDTLINSPLILLHANSFLNIEKVSISSSVDTLFELNSGSTISITESEINSATMFGELFYFNGTSGSVTLKSSSLTLSGTGQPEWFLGGSSSKIARDGIPASGIISIVNNTFDPGDSVTIGTTTFTQGVDFLVGINAAATALNLAKVINVQIANLVYAVVNSSTVQLFATNYGTGGNSIPLTKSDGGTLNFVLSAATLLNGVNGSGNVINIDHCNFENGNSASIQSSIRQVYATDNLGVRREGARLIVYVSSGLGSISGGFKTINEALEYVNAHGEPFNTTIKIAPGTYVENVNWGNFQDLHVIGDVQESSTTAPYNSGVSSIQMIGNFVFNQTNGAAHFYNLNFVSTPSGNMFDIQGSNNFVTFTNCTFEAEMQPNTSLLNVNCSGQVLVKDCFFDLSASVSGARAITQQNNSNCQVFLRYCNFLVQGTAPGNIDITALKTGDNTLAFPSFTQGYTVEYCVFRGSGGKMFDVGTNGYIYSHFNKMGLNASGSSVIYFSGNGTFTLLNSYLDGNFQPGAVLARDGTAATATITLTGNSYPGGSGFNINGASFVNGVGFTVGVTAAATATNLASAVNASNNVNIFRKVYAVANANIVTLYSYTWSTAANAFTVALIGAAPATLISWGGGLNGSGGTLAFGGSTFSNPITQSTLTYSSQPTIPVFI